MTQNIINAVEKIHDSLCIEAAQNGYQLAFENNGMDMTLFPLRTALVGDHFIRIQGIQNPQGNIFLNFTEVLYGNPTHKVLSNGQWSEGETYQNLRTKLYEFKTSEPALDTSRFQGDEISRLIAARHGHAQLKDSHVARVTQALQDKDQLRKSHQSYIEAQIKSAILKVRNEFAPEVEKYQNIFTDTGEIRRAGEVLIGDYALQLSAYLENENIKYNIQLRNYFSEQDYCSPGAIGGESYGYNPAKWHHISEIRGIKESEIIPELRDSFVTLIQSQPSLEHRQEQIARMQKINLPSWSDIRDLPGCITWPLAAAFLLALEFGTMYTCHAIRPKRSQNDNHPDPQKIELTLDQR